MKLKIALLSFAAIAVLLFAYKVPQGWIVAGTMPDKYEMGTDPGSGRNGNNAATIKSEKRHIKGFGTLMQNISTDQYKGKRIRLTGYLKSDNVDGWAGLWLRVDGRKKVSSVQTTYRHRENSSRITSDVSGNDKRKTLAFDNMYNRQVTGTTTWTKCEIVLDVADTASNIAFGALLSGTGQIWLDELKFDTVSHDVLTTSNKNDQPANLDFK